MNNPAPDELETLVAALENAWLKGGSGLPGLPDRPDLQVRLERLLAALHEQAIRDPLTNLFNRRYLQETLERELARVGREGDPLALVILDIDHFKRLNDTFGHPAGDLMLQALAMILNSRTRLGDVACRYGGQEFVVVMPGAAPQTAYQRAEQLRTSFEAVNVRYGDTVLQATISLGIAGYPEHATMPDELVHCADQALHAAKAAGRNRSVIWGV